MICPGSLTMPESTWQGILRVLADGKRHTAAEIGDRIGHQHNTVQRYIHDLRHGETAVGVVDIGDAMVDGKPYKEYWLAAKADPYKEWRDIISKYPPDHTERVKYEAIMA